MDEKKMRIALIISAAILLIGGIILSVATILPFFKPLGITLVVSGAVMTFFTFYFWTMAL